MTLHPRRIFSILTVLVISSHGYSAEPIVGPTRRSAPALTPVRGVSPSPQIAPRPTVATVRTPTLAYPGLGGQIFSTGLADVIVKIVPQSNAYEDDLYLITDDAKLKIGENVGKTNTIGKIKLGENKGRITTINLGKLPAGEILLSLKVRQTGNEWLIGPADRNIDGISHATVNPMAKGGFEVRWEDLFGGPDGTPAFYPDRMNCYADFFVEFSGGVTADSTVSGKAAAVADLVKVVHEQKGEVRAAALATLQKLDPAAARKAALE